MAYEFVNWEVTGALLTHQKMTQLAENDDFLATAWSSYKRPGLIYKNSTTVSVEENTGTANESKTFQKDGSALFANGLLRECDLTKTADFSSGSPRGGLYTSYTLTANRWYYIWAVKCTDASQEGNFVLVAEELGPFFLNTGTLLTRYGQFGHYYLGLIRYGDSLSAPTDILDFKMSGGLTMFKNSITGNSGRGSVGIQLATGIVTPIAGVTYTHAVGRGDLEIPENVDGALYMSSFVNNNGQINVRDSGGVLYLARTNGGYQNIHDVPASFGLNAVSPTRALDIYLAGFRDAFFRPDHNKFIY